MRIEPPPRSEIGSFQAEYVARVAAAVDPALALRRQCDSFASHMLAVPANRAGFRYDAGKWTVADVMGHLADTERILSYRLLRVARGDKTPMPGFEENEYVAAADFNRRSLTELVEDWRAVRNATIRLVEGLDEEAWKRLGTANAAPTSTRALLFVILGHVEHHRASLEERYGIGR